MSVVRGPIVLADIAGYTRYLGGVELEHSRDVLADLIGTVAGQLGNELEVAKLEGDAVFCVGGERASEGQRLMTAIESSYLAFAYRRRTIAVATSCRCEACRRIPELDLKFVAHWGSWAEHEVAGSRELVGPDVVLAHRLLKNTVTEETGVDAYALLTDPALEALGRDAEPLDLKPHRERYEDVGEIGAGVLDLGERWREEQERSQVLVRPGEEDFSFVAALEASPPRVWYAMTDPSQQARWRIGVDRIDEENPTGGRGVGSVAHCVHGKDVIDQEILDWRPHRYYSYAERNPAGRCLWTIALEPLDGEGDGAPRTRLSWRVKLTGGLGQRAMMVVMRRRMSRILREYFESLVAFVNEGEPGRRADL